MAEFHEKKISLWVKLLALIAGIAILLGASILTASLNDQRVFKLHAKGVTKQVHIQKNQTLASSYLEYLPVKAALWARDSKKLTGTLSAVGIIIAGMVFALIALGLVLGARRGQYNHESVIDQMYERRFLELKSRFLKLLGRV